MTLNISQISHIAQDVIEDGIHARHLHGVTATDGGSGRVEILMTVGNGQTWFMRRILFVIYVLVVRQRPLHPKTCFG